MNKETSMQTPDNDVTVIGNVDDTFSKAEREEMGLLGILDAEGRILQRQRREPQVPRKQMTSLNILNEAYDYELPSSFSRGLAVPIKAGTRMLWISGTASIDDHGVTVYTGDFRAQLWRTFRNITELLSAESATWHDIVRTSCYLRDIERDYDEFNKVRTLFFECMAVDPVPASTGIQARLCRSDLLIEIEAFAAVQDEVE